MVRLRDTILILVALLTLAILAESIQRDVYTDVDFYRGVCDDNIDVMYLRNNIVLRNASWPSEIPYPCLRTANLLVEGRSFNGSLVVLNMNSLEVARRLTIQPGTSVTFKNFKADRFKYGGEVPRNPYFSAFRRVTRSSRLNSDIPQLRRWLQRRWRGL